MLGIGSNRLFALLRNERVLDPANLPYQRFIDRGYFKVHRGHWEHPSIGPRYYARTLVTHKGMDWLADFIEQKKTA